MIYLKNNTEIQAIYIPRQTVLGGGYIPSTKAYDKGYNDGLEVGKEQQKGKLSNLNVTENGQYEREDGWNVVNVDVPDLNGSYNEGYEQGKAEGIDEQKAKLESISITENGTYNKEDGYNHIEVNVPSYEEGQADMAAKARVLEVTENGTYLSKFSDPIPPTLVTGMYADGTEFYNYAELKGKVFNTKIAGSVDSRLEFWYKGNHTGTGNAWDVMIGSGNNDDDDCFQVRYFSYNDEILYIGVGNSYITVYNWDDTVWHHLIVSKAEGLWIDGEKKGDFSPSNTINGEFFINAIGYNPLRNANGCFGMIKIDDVVFIPTADGFKNTNTGELLEVVKDGGYIFTENIIRYGEGELYKTINVNVPDLNGSYDEGKTDGINEQKSKLETINITENGTYNREDGYNKVIVKVPDLNGSYDEGYEQGQADMAAKARVLEVTENGTYLSKFSDPIPPTVTGVYADGTEFYDYAYLEGISYDSGFKVSEDMEVEIWWKGDVSKTDKNLFGSQVNNNYAIFKIRIPFTAHRFDAEIAMRAVTYLNAESDRWYHFKMSYADGFWVDGVKIGDFSDNISGTPDELYINSNTPNSFNGVNGYFGMIKITTNGVENIIIPTAEGLKNITTNEMLQVEQNGSYTYTENVLIYGEGELYKTINVNVPDLNGSYDEGKIDGINEQKSKLETIEITQNATYNREDGYNKVIVKVPDLNGSYDEGYDQGQADIAENAIVLNVTENGVYKTKFSDPIMPTLVTGVYADGTKFYNYAQLGNKVYNTNITVTQDSVVELWYKGDNAKTDDGWNTIFSCVKREDDYFWMGYWDIDNTNTNLNTFLGQESLQFSWDENAWHHIIMKNEGLWIDGALIGSFNTTKTFAYKLGLNSDGDSLIRNANGYYGMIKIDDVIIIPTADGFLNTNTGELLEVVKDGAYTFTKNLPTYGEGEIYKTINVNVPTEAASCNLINPIVFSKEAGNTINAENVQIPAFVYEGNQYYNVDDFNLADIEEFKIHILFKPNNRGDAEPINVFGCEDTDWDNTTFGARIYQGQIYFRMSGQDVAFPYTENAWYDVEMGYNTTKRWVIVNGEALLDAEYASFNRPRQTLMIGAINRGGNAFRPFYGKIAAIYIESDGNQVWLLPKEDGTMGVYWNGINSPYNTISGENNARFENDYISGDGMKSITWLGNLEDKWVTPSMNDRDSNGYIVVSPSEGYCGLERTVINPQTLYNEGFEAGRAECVCPSVQEQSFNYDITAFTYKVYDWTSVNINRDNITNDCGDRPLDCLLFRNRSGECTVMTKFDTCSGTARLENGWSGDSIILSLKSNSITKFSSNSINSNRLTSIDTGFAKLEGNAITNCNALTDIKVTVLNDDLSTQFAANCFNGLPAEGTITIGKNVDVTITDNEITSFFRALVGEGWTITIK